LTAAVIQCIDDADWCVPHRGRMGMPRGDRRPAFPRKTGFWAILRGRMPADLKQSFTGRHLINRRLTGPGSAKDTRHHEIGIERPGATYLPGDALGIHALNEPELVDRVLGAVGATGDEIVPGPDGSPVAARHALTAIYNLTTPSRRLLELLIERGAADLAPLLDRANAEALKQYLNGWNEAHDVLDVLLQHPDARLSIDELAGALRKTLPRLYSIASSEQAHPGQVHLLVVGVRYTIRDRERNGICSTWLAERWPVGETAEMYLQNQQKHFSMPADPATPMIMVGPGTGLAPFRAFVEERRAAGATGRNWLFFGEQRRATDFFYEDELTAYAREGFLRLDVAFSRDQEHKIYVQHRMREQAKDIWAWLEQGAEFFVCGDKERMASDVDRELLAIVEQQGGRSPDQALQYVAELRRAKRYKRDVY
jgi:sulfite reductase (NADPH) flavoprotein alpha-component